MMSTVAETAELAWGYTMDDLDRLTRAALRATRMSTWGMFDRDERYECAWSAIAECLYASRTYPEGHELLYAGSSAILRAGQAEARHHGMSVKTRTQTISFTKYWEPPSERTDGFSEKVIERMALPQVLSQLTPRQYEVIAALAVHGSNEAAARALGMKRSAFSVALSSARKRAIAAWMAPETPRQKYVPGQTCREGHSITEHGRRTETGRMRCAICELRTQRMYTARVGTADHRAGNISWQQELNDAATPVPAA